MKLILAVLLLVFMLSFTHLSFADRQCDINGHIAYQSKTWVVWSFETYVGTITDESDSYIQCEETRWYFHKIYKDWVQATREEWLDDDESLSNIPEAYGDVIYSSPKNSDETHLGQIQYN